MPPNDQLLVNWMEHALVRGPSGVETLLARNLKSRLASPRDQREEELATAIANYDLLDQSLQFIPR